MSKADEKAALLDQFKQSVYRASGKNKEEYIAHSAARKDATLNRDGLPSTEQNFLLLNPNSTEEDLNNYRNAKAVQDSQLAYEQTQLDALKDRSVAEGIKDTALGLGAQGIIGIGEVAYGLADLAVRGKSRPGFDISLDKIIEDTTGINVTESFARSREAINSALSKPLQARKEILAKKSSERAEEYKAGEQAYVENYGKDLTYYIGKVGNQVKEFGKSAYDTGGSPSVAIQSFLESAPQLLLGGAVGSLARKTAAKGITKETSKEAAEKILQKAGTSAGIATTAATEGVSNAMQVKAEVLRTDFADLEESSPLYKELLAQNISPDEARKYLANQAFDVTLVIAGTVGGLASKFSGAGKIEGNLFSLTSKTGKKITDSIKSTAGKLAEYSSAKAIVAEGAEEGIQGVAGELAGNVAKRVTTDEEQDILEGTGAAGGQSLVVGALSGGVIGAPKGAAQAVVDAAGAASKTELAESVREEAKIKKAVTSGDIKELTDTESESYNPVTAYRAEQAAYKNKLENDEEINLEEYKGNLNKHQAALLDETAKLNEQALAVKDSDPDKYAELSKERDAKIKIALKLSEQTKGVVNKDFSVKDASENLDAFFSEESTNEAKNTAGIRLFGSMQSRSISGLETAKKLAGSPDLTPEAKTQVDNFIATEEAVADLTSADGKTLEGVNQDVLTGGPGFLGIRDHLSSVALAVSSGDKATTKKNIDRFETFVKNHTRKAAFASKAYKAFLEGDDTLAKEYEAEYGNFINEKSKRVIAAMRKEAVALQTGLKEAKAMQPLDTVVTPQQETTPQQPAKVSKPAEGTRGDSPSVSEAKADTVEQDTQRKAVEDAVATLESNNALPVAVEKARNAEGKIELTDAQIKTQGKKLIALAESTTKETKQEVKQETKPVVEKAPVKTPEVKPEVKKESEPVKATETKVEETVTKKEASSPNYRKKINEIRSLMNPKVLAKFAKEKGYTKHIKAIMADKPLNTLTTKMLDGLVELVKTKAKESASKLLSTRLMEQAYSAKEGEPSLLSQFFETRPDAKTSKNVLQLFPDFFQQIKIVGSEANTYVKNNLTREQKLELRDLINFEQAFYDSFYNKDGSGASVFSHKNEKVILEDMFQLLRNNNYDPNDPSTFLDRNIISQIAMTSFDYINNNANNLMFNNASDVSQLLGRDSKEVPSDSEMALLGDKGNLESVVIDSLGLDLFNQLGLRSHKKNGRGDYESKMIAALGTAAVAGMLQADLLEQESVPISIFSKMYNSDSTGFGEKDTVVGSVYFLRTKRRDITTPEGYIETIPGVGVESVFEVAKNKTGVSELLFAASNITSGPTITKPTTVVSKVKKTGQKIAAKARKIIGKAQQTPHKLKPQLVEMYEVLGKYGLAEMMGYIPNPEKQPHILKVKLPSIVSKNRAILSSIKHLEDFIEYINNQEEGLETEFYFNIFMAQTGRLFLDSNTVNIQSDKLHRHFMGTSDFDVTVDATAENDLLDRFKFAVAEALGVKVDKVKPDVALEAFNDFSNEGVIYEGALAILESRQEYTTDARKKELKDVILKAVKEGGEEAASLDGLVALAEFIEAREQGREFSTNLFREVDGITNGIAISALQIAATKMKSILPKMGIFFDGETSPNEYFNTPGNQDIYETVSKNWIDFVKQVITSPKSTTTHSEINALKFFIGSFTDKENNITELGRKYGKPIAMQTSYQASVKTLIASFTRKAQDNVYSKISDALATGTKEEQQQKLNLISDALNALSIDNRTKIKLTVNNAKQFSLDSASASGIKNGITTTVKNTYGTALYKALETTLGPLKEEGTNVVAAVSLMAEMYIALYEDKLAQVEEQNGHPADQSTIQEVKEELAELFPILSLPLSELDDGSGVVVVGTDRDTVTGEQYKSYRNKMNFKGQGLKNTKAKVKDKTGALSISSQGKAQKLSPPGVGSLVKLIQSLDGTIMLMMMDKFKLLNVHDAVGLAIDKEVEGTDEFNRIFGEIAGSYSIGSIVKNELNRVTQEFANLAEGTNASNKSVEIYIEGTKIKKPLAELLNSDYTTNLLNSLELMDINRTETTSEITGIKQYNNNTPAESIDGVTNKVEEAKDVALPEVSTDTLTKDEREFIDRVFEEAFRDVQLDEENDHRTDVTSSNQEPQDDKPQNVTHSRFTAFALKIGTPKSSDALDLQRANENLNKRVWPEFKKFIEHITKDNNSSGAKVLNDTLKRISTKVYEDSSTLENSIDSLLNSISEFQTKNATYKKSSTYDIDVDSFVPTETVELTKENIITKVQEIGKLDVQRGTQDSVEHQEHLVKVTEDLIAPVMDAIEAQFEDRKVKESFGKADPTNNTVYVVRATDPKAHSLAMSTQETTVHELIHVITEALDSVPGVRAEVKKLFNIAKKKLKPTDFLEDPADVSDPDLMAAAQARFDYIFNNLETSNVNIKADYTGSDVELQRNNALHEFLTLGLSNKQVMRALSTIKPEDLKEYKPRLKDLKFTAGSVVDYLAQLFKYLSDALVNKINSTSNLAADKKLMSLAQRLVGVETHKDNLLAKNLDYLSKLNESTRTALSNFVVAPLIKLAESDLVSKSKVGVVRNVGGIISAVPHVKAKAAYDVMKQVRRRMGGTSRDLVGSLMTEAVGATDAILRWHKLNARANKEIDQARMHIISQVRELLNNNFVSEQKLTREEKRAINQVLKLDMVVLADSYDMGQLIDLLSDSDFLASEINKIEQQILSLYKNNGAYYIDAANSLASKVAVGIHTQSNSMQNAHNVANLFAFNGAGKLEGDIVLATQLIDKLSSLKAIPLASQKDIGMLTEVMQREYAVDGTSNGITFLLAMHKKFKEDSLDQLFEGQVALTTKGYIKELYNDNISFIVAPLSEEADLLARGYKKGAKVKRDKLNPQEDMYFFTNSDGLDTGRLSGTVSLTNEKSKGTDLLSSHLQLGSLRPVQQASKDLSILTKQSTQRLVSDLKSGSKAVTDTYAVPIVNAQGRIVGYRYEMNQQTRTDLLERNDSFDDVFGAMEASISDKVNSKFINAQVVKEAYDDYNDNFEAAQDEFVYIGLDASNPEYREMYQLMPDAMRKEVRATWGRDGIYLREEVVDLVFGYKKFNVNQLEKLGDRLAGSNNSQIKYFGEKLAKLSYNPKLVMAQNTWQQVIKLFKDFIVVKTGVVLAGNVVSNFVLLSMKGVSIVDMMRDHYTAMKGVREYQKHSAEIFKLEREIQLAPNAAGNRTKQLRINSLKEDIAANPVRELIDAGTYQSIVEDIDLEDDAFVYQDKLDKLIDPVNNLLDKNKVGRAAKTIGKNILMTHDTAIYKFMLESTQLSDFIARYTLHNHNVKNKKMSKEESITDIVRTFVNYDLPTHKGIQYANDMGAVIFTKYLIRMQRVLMDTLGENPARVFAWLMLQNSFGDVADAYDANLLTEEPIEARLNSPLDVITSWPDTAVVSLGKSLL